MKHVNEELILQYLKDGGRATYAYIESETPQKMNKGGRANTNPLLGKKVTKRSALRVMLNVSYESMMEKALGEPYEAKGEAFYRKVYDSVNGSIACHKDDESRRYLVFALRGETRLEWFVDGVRATDVEEETIREYRPKRTYTEKEVDWRTLNLDNIRVLHVNGERIVFPAPAPTTTATPTPTAPTTTATPTPTAAPTPTEPTFIFGKGETNHTEDSLAAIFARMDAEWLKRQAEAVKAVEDGITPSAE